MKKIKIEMSRAEIIEVVIVIVLCLCAFIAFVCFIEHQDKMWMEIVEAYCATYNVECSNANERPLLYIFCDGDRITNLIGKDAIFNYKFLIEK